MGAEKTATGHIKADLIADELSDFMRESGERRVVPGYVIATVSGQLAIPHNVKRIFHAASVEGVVGKGYRVISDVELCVNNALQLADEKKFSEEHLKSILFPLFGTGKGKAPITQNGSQFDFWSYLTF